MSQETTQDKIQHDLKGYICDSGLVKRHTTSYRKFKTLFFSHKHQLFIQLMQEEDPSLRGKGPIKLQSTPIDNTNGSTNEYMNRDHMDLCNLSSLIRSLIAHREAHMCWSPTAHGKLPYLGILTVVPKS